MLQEFADWISYALFGLAKDSHIGAAANFFIYDSIKVTLLLAVIVFIVGVIRTFITPNKIKKLLGKKREGIGNIFAALLGIPTPFCSCSAVPLFLGFLEAGVPLGVTFSFLIASPLINEVAAVMLFAMFGWQIALLYVASGFAIAVIAGIIIGRLHLEKEVEKIKCKTRIQRDEKWNWKERLEFGLSQSKTITLNVLPYLLVGIAIGGLIHGYAPQDLLLKIAGTGNFFAVPIAVLIGIPLYSNAAGMVPIVGVLISKGMGIGTALAFMMSVIGLSLPELIILRKMLKPKLLIAFVLIMFLALVFTGYLFNLILG